MRHRPASVRRGHRRIDERLTSDAPLIGGCLVCDTLLPRSFLPQTALPQSPTLGTYHTFTGLTEFLDGRHSDGGILVLPPQGEEGEAGRHSPPYKQSLSRPFHTTCSHLSCYTIKSNFFFLKVNSASIDNRQVSCVKERSRTTRIFPIINHPYHHHHHHQSQHRPHRDAA